MNTTIRLFAAAALLAAAAPAQAQWMSDGPLFAVHEEVVKPAMLAQYEAANQDFKRLVTDHRAAMPHFSFAGFQGEDFTYLFMAPIADLNGFAAIGGDFAALAQAAGPRFGEVMGRANAAIETIRDYVIQEDPALSYVPADPRVTFESTTFRKVDFYHLMPGTEAEADAIAREFLALYRAKNLRSPYHIYKGVLGGESPTLLVVSLGKDEPDYIVAEAADRAALGDAGKALFARALAITRRFETRRYTLRPDLVVAPIAR